MWSSPNSQQNSISSSHGFPLLFRGPKIHGRPSSLPARLIRHRGAKSRIHLLEQTVKSVRFKGYGDQQQFDSLFIIINAKLCIYFFMVISKLKFRKWNFTSLKWGCSMTLTYLHNSITIVYIMYIYINIYT